MADCAKMDNKIHEMGFGEREGSVMMMWIRTSEFNSSSSEW